MSEQPDWQYVAFFDASSGARDAAALAIARVEPDRGPRAVVVFQRRWPAPHSPSAVITEAAGICREYNISVVRGDRYAVGFVIEGFAAERITYQPSELTRSELYAELVPLVATGKVELPRNERLRRELIALHRRTRSGGKDVIDHPVGGSDDLANAVAGAVVHAWRAASQAASPDRVFPNPWLKAAQERWESQPPRGVPQCALGTGIRGQRAPLLAVRHDGWFAPLIVVPGVKHGRDLAAAILRHRQNQALPVIDVGEAFGEQAYAHLRGNEMDAHAWRPLNEARERTVERQTGFANRRSAAYWRFREALDPEQVTSPIALPNDPELISQLEAVRWRLTKAGIAVQLKEELEADLGRPGDRADAVVASWYQGPRAMTHIDNWRSDQRVGRSYAGKRKPQVNLGPRHRTFISRRSR